MATPRFMQRILGIATDVPAVQVGGASSANQIPALNASGVLDGSMFGPGIGDDLLALPASEAVTGPALVNVTTVSGAANVRNADSGTPAAGRQCSGFVLSSVASGATAPAIYSHGLMTGLSGLTPGAYYYLGATGVPSLTPPSASGTTVQGIGYAVSATAIDVQPQTPIAIQ